MLRDGVIAFIPRVRCLKYAVRSRRIKRLHLGRSDGSDGMEWRAAVPFYKAFDVIIRARMFRV